jgi:hypothetical protein
MTPESLRPKVPKPPKGFFPSVEWARKWKLSKPRTQAILCDAVERGVVKRIKCLRSDGTGGARPCNYYGPV